VGSLLIKNIGKLVSGDLSNPLLDSDSVLVKDGLIEKIGNGLNASSDSVIDAAGMDVMPGLFDSHIHPLFGDFTPRQNAFGFIESEVHGGVTSFISAGEVHLPGRPRGDKDVSMALAILASKSFKSVRPLGAKVHAGALILEKGLTGADFHYVRSKGVWLVGEVGLGSVQEPAEAAEMVALAHNEGMKVMIHTGGASIPGSTVIGAEVVLKVKPDVVSHINGGPTSPPLDDIRRIVMASKFAIEIVQCGNFRSMIETVKILKERGEMNRLIIGNDAPSGSGLMPLGVLRTLHMISSLGGVPPAEAICAATGNTARTFGLDEGQISEGKPADLVLFDAPFGSVANSGIEALSIGDIPSVALVLIDGEPKVGTSRNTPPPKRKLGIEGALHIPAGGH